MLLEKQLNLDPGQLNITLSSIETDSVDLELKFIQEYTFSQDVTYNADLGSLLKAAGVSEDILEFISSIADITGSFNIPLFVSFQFRVGLGLEIRDGGSSMTPYIISDTGLVMLLKLGVEIDELKMMMGPLSVDIVNSELVLEGDDDGYASIRYGLDESQYKYYFNSNITKYLSLTYDGSIHSQLHLGSPFDQTKPLNISIPNLQTYLEGKAGVIANYSKNYFTSFITTLQDTNPLAIILNDPVSLINGIDNGLGLVQGIITGADGAISEIKVPLIGNDLSIALEATDQFIGKFRTEVLTTVRNAIQSVSGQANQNSLALIIQYQLTTLLDSKLGILLDGVNLTILDANNTDLTQEYIDSNYQVVPPTADAVQWTFVLGDTYGPSFNPSFDLGLDGIPIALSVDGKIEVDIQWSMFFGFGISLRDGLYILIEPDQIEFEVTIESDALSVVGTLFVMQLEGAFQDPSKAGIIISVGPTSEQRLTLSNFGKLTTSLFETQFNLASEITLDLTLKLDGDFLPSFTTTFYAGWAENCTLGGCGNSTSEAYLLNVTMLAWQFCGEIPGPDYRQGVYRCSTSTAHCRCVE